MTTKITFIGDLPIEQQELDEQGAAARDRLNDLVLAEYEQTGCLTSVHLSEAVEEFETYAVQHIRKDPAADEEKDV